MVPAAVQFTRSSVLSELPGSAHRCFKPGVAQIELVASLYSLPVECSLVMLVF